MWNSKIKQTALWALVLGGMAQAALGAAPEESSQSFQEWEVKLQQQVYSALVADSPSDTLHLLKLKGTGAVFGQMCNPAPGGTCAWVISAKAPCEAGKSVFWNATFGTEGMAHSSTKRLEASCEGARGDFYQYVVSDRDAAGIPALLSQVGAEATDSMSLEGMQATVPRPAYHFHVAGFPEAYNHLRLALQQAQGVSPPQRKKQRRSH